jgi:hypothetical protein
MVTRPKKTLVKDAPAKRKILITVGIVAALFVVANIAMVIMYHDRALPNYHLGKLAIGGKSLDELEATKPSDILAAALTFAKNDKTISKSPEDLGVHVDIEKSLHSANGGLRWLPVFSLFGRHHIALTLQIDHDQYNKTTAKVNNALSQQPVKQHIDFDGSNFVIKPNQDGYEVNTDKLLPSVTSAFQKGQSQLTVSTQTIHATDHADLSGQLASLQKQLDLKLSFAYRSQTIQPSRSDIGKWFTGKGQTMTMSTTRFKSYIISVGKRLGIAVANQSNLAVASAYALGKNLPMEFAIVPSNSATVVRTYCTAVRGVNPAVLPDLNGKLAATYADVRGWNDNGRIVFQKVASGCQYTVWMSAANQMTTFGAICDDFYNCQVGTSVVMNYNRWTSATPPWNKTGRSLEDYHVLMINHESGHRLGFLDNPTCPGAGKPAPVMMQQSINLKGCTFNIWPLASEFTALNKTL